MSGAELETVISCELLCGSCVGVAISHYLYVYDRLRFHQSVGSSPGGASRSTGSLSSRGNRHVKQAFWKPAAMVESDVSDHDPRDALPAGGSIAVSQI